MIWTSPTFQNIIFVLSFLCLSSVKLPLLFCLIHLQPWPENRQVTDLLLHAKEKHSQTRIKWCDDTISRDTLYFYAWLCGRRKWQWCVSNQTAYQLFISWGSLQAWGWEVCLVWRTESWWTGRSAGRDMEAEQWAWLSRSVSTKTITRRQADHL